jgi:hypothetical protein
MVEKGFDELHGEIRRKMKLSTPWPEDWGLALSLGSGRRFEVHPLSHLTIPPSKAGIRAPNG